jgi:type I restriction enzyme, S subunit
MGPIGAVPASWKLYPLGQLATKIGSGATPRGGAHVYVGTSQAAARLIRSQNVFDRRFDRSGLVGITQADADSLAAVSVQKNDVLLNITGDGITFARSCLAPADILPACVNQHVCIIRLDQSRAVPGYVVSFLTHRSTKRYIESFNAGGSRRAVTKGHIESFVIPLPPLSEQLAIAATLEVLDDKIELNRRMNKALEATAQTILSRAVEGNGWVGCVGDVGILSRDAIDPASLGSLPVEYYSLPAFDVGRRPVMERADRIKSNKFVVPQDSVLVSKLNPQIPRVWLPWPSKDYRALASTEWLVVRPSDATLRSLLYAVCASSRMRQELSGRVTGTTGSHQRVLPVDFMRIVVRLPTPNKWASVARHLDLPYELAASNALEADLLGRLRDLLLPKMLSGELRVKQAQKLVEEAV